MQIQFSPLMFVGALLVGIISAFYARKKGKNPYFWFTIGFVFGIFGILAIFFAPFKKKVVKEPVVAFNLKGPNDKLWYYFDKVNEQQGPMSRDALISAWKSGKIGPATYLWHEELPEWKPLSEFSEK